MARREGARIRTRSFRNHGSNRGPVRTCVGCRNRAWASELLRVVAEDGRAPRVAVPDPRQRQAGRGAWLHPDPACLHLAERRRAFPRALRVPGPLELSAVQDHLKWIVSERDDGAHVAHDETDAGTSRARR